MAARRELHRYVGLSGRLHLQKQWRERCQPTCASRCGLAACCACQQCPQHYSWPLQPSVWFWQVYIFALC